jgi:hypothetical protein
MQSTTQVSARPVRPTGFHDKLTEAVAAPRMGLFIAIPNEVARDKRLPHGLKLLFGAILSLSRCSLGRCTASNETLATMTAQSARNVERGLPVLERLRYIHRVMRSGVSREIRITWTASKEEVASPANGQHNTPDILGTEPPTKCRCNPPTKCRSKRMNEKNERESSSFAGASSPAHAREATPPQNDDDHLAPKRTDQTIAIPEVIHAPMPQPVEPLPAVRTPAPDPVDLDRDGVLKTIADQLGAELEAEARRCWSQLSRKAKGNVECIGAAAQDAATSFRQKKAAGETVHRPFGFLMTLAENYAAHDIKTPRLQGNPSDQPQPDAIDPEVERFLRGRITSNLVALQAQGMAVHEAKNEVWSRIVNANHRGEIPHSGTVVHKMLNDWLDDAVRPLYAAEWESDRARARSGAIPIHDAMASPQPVLALAV